MFVTRGAWAAWLAGLSLAAGCGHFHHHSVKVDQVPPAVRQVIEARTAGAEICYIKETEGEDGAVLYKVKYKKKPGCGKLEVNADGRLVEMEEPVTLDQLPAPVRATVERETAGGSIKELELEIEEDETFYEVEFYKDGREQELSVRPDGSVAKRE